MYRPPTEKKNQLHAHRGPGGTCLRKQSHPMEVTFEVAEGWDTKQIASEINKVAQQRGRIEDYRSYGIYPGKPGELGNIYLR